MAIITSSEGSRIGHAKYRNVDGRIYSKFQPFVLTGLKESSRTLRGAVLSEGRA
jgi:hypothetical protein